MQSNVELQEGDLDECRGSCGAEARDTVPSHPSQWHSCRKVTVCPRSQGFWMERGRQHAEYIPNVTSGYFEQQVFCLVLFLI